jgi:hypothetical protein
MGYWLEGWTGDNAGPTVGRKPNTLLVTEIASEGHKTTAFRYSVQVQGKPWYPYLYVSCLTPGAKEAVVTGVEGNVGGYFSVWSVELTEADFGVGDHWTSGVHIFSVAVNVSNVGGAERPFATTLATAVIDERVPKVDFNEPGVAAEWVKTMQMEGPIRWSHEGIGY